MSVTPTPSHAVQVARHGAAHALPAAAGCSAPGVRRPACSVGTSGSALPVMAACCSATRIAASMSASTFSSRERDSDWISSSSCVRCIAVSATRASSSATLAAASRASVLRLARQRARLGGLALRCPAGGAPVPARAPCTRCWRVPGEHQRGRARQRPAAPARPAAGTAGGARRPPAGAAAARQAGRRRGGGLRVGGGWRRGVVGHGAADCIGAARARPASAGDHGLRRGRRASHLAEARRARGLRDARVRGQRRRRATSRRAGASGAQVADRLAAAEQPQVRGRLGQRRVPAGRARPRRSCGARRAVGGDEVAPRRRARAACRPASRGRLRRAPPARGGRPSRGRAAAPTALRSRSCARRRPARRCSAVGHAGCAQRRAGARPGASRPARRPARPQPAAAREEVLAPRWG